MLEPTKIVQEPQEICMPYREFLGEKLLSFGIIK